MRSSAVKDEASADGGQWGQSPGQPLLLATPHATPEAQSTRTIHGIPKIEGDGSTSSPDVAVGAQASEEFHWDDAIAVLKDGRLAPRPSRITDCMAA
eukprot:COSAG02_NODE_24910_length_674_cov_1.013913_1_plen_96_part_10